jgi:acetyl esterase/lipase
MIKATAQIIFLGILLVSTKAFPQDFSCTNLIKTIYSESEIKKPNDTDNPVVSYAKPNTQIMDVHYANDFLGGNQCSKTDGCNDGSDKLQYEVYYPDIVYTNPLPGIIFFHGGGLSDCTNFNHSEGGSTYCIEFAKRGFVAFNVEYRRGRVDDPVHKYTSASDILAFYRAIQDGKGAIRTIVERELNRAEPYRIAVQNIFLAGASSGAALSLQIAFYTRKMNKQVFGNMDSYLGAIDTDSYAGNAAPRTYRIRGVLDLWGRAVVPVNFADNLSAFFSQNRKIPVVIAFQGASDNVISIDTGNVFYSTSPSAYASESLCVAGGTYTLPDNGAKKPDLKTLGARALYNLLTASLKIPAELYLDCDMKHGLDEATSDFGLASGDATAVTDKQVQKYIVQRAATFFQYVMNENFPYKLSNTKFIDCQNTRYGCNPDANTSCSNNVCASSSVSTLSFSQESTQGKAANLFIMAEENKTIYLNFLKTGNTKIEMFNLSGATIKTVQCNTHQTVINCSDLSSGLYLLRVLQGNSIQTKKIILQ